MLIGERDPKKLGTVAAVGAGYGMASKELLDYVAPQLPDDEKANFAKGAAGPLAVKYFPNALNVGSEVNRSLQGK